MGPSQRPETTHLNLSNNLNSFAASPQQQQQQQQQQQPRSGSSTAATSPIEPPSSAGAPSSTGSARLPIGAGLTQQSSMSSLRTGSPSHEYGSRLYSKRAREIQAQEGIGSQVWGPPTSGNSTPLRETIPESPNGDSFPDFSTPSLDAPAGAGGAVRGRTRAGTLPSRFSPAAGLSILSPQTSGLISKTSRPTPSTSPFKPGSSTPTDVTGFPTTPGSSAAKTSLLQRLRAGSMPQRPGMLPSSGPFGPSIFNTTWNSRDRSTTLASIRSSEGPTSPAQSSFSRDSLADTDVRTLDYLGLVDTPKPSMATLAGPDIGALLSQQQYTGLPPQTIADLAAYTKNANRFRSYSVNAKEKYADEDEELSQTGYGSYSGAMTPEGGSAAAYATIQEAVRQHNLEVQAFANFAHATRPRARTAGVLDSPSTRLMRSYLPQPSQLNNSLTSAELRLAEEAEYGGLEEAVEKLHLKSSLLADGAGDEHNVDSPTRALWLGNIPASTTVSSLQVIFSPYGPIESARVLTHKNCGFVNFENLEHAVNARIQLNGKEIFPGAGPVRIGYAKVPSAAATPGANGLLPSPSPDPQLKGQQTDAAGQSAAAGATALGHSGSGSGSDPAGSKKLDLNEIKPEILDIVKELGATEEDLQRVASIVDQSIELNHYEAEIPPVSEPSHNRMHDAPRLREIRKRIDNSSCSPAEIEDIALNMLDEIAELSSDYLGNTVVQKLFEHCSENVKQAMLERIAPHLAEIGVHKNGTWAAQKIIDVARSHSLMSLIVEALRPYGMALFLDQYGNYVMQGCLRYQYPLNDFIFQVMVCRLWELAQGRFGARAMRACLESHYATKDQQRTIAAVIALHSVQLATNANGALLLTWFLDTCTFPRRRSVLAPRLVPHLVHLCTHKVAYLTVLKIINQRNEPEARETILKALFFSPNDQVLEDILSDQQCGSTLIFKVLTTPFFDDSIRNDVVQNVRNVLLRIKAQPQQGYKRLMDEVGLSTRNGGPRDIHAPREDGPRPSSKHSNHAQQSDSPISRPFYPGVPQTFDPSMNMQRTASMDSNTFDAYSMNGMQAPMYPTSNPAMANMNPMTPQQQQQMQYQQAAMLAASRPQQASYFPQGVQMNGGYPSPAQSLASLDAYRNVQSPMGLNSNLMQQAGFGAPPGFGLGANQGMFPGYPMQYVPPGVAHTGMGGGGRRRVSPPRPAGYGQHY
jgi:protein JSN1